MRGRLVDEVLDFFWCFEGIGRDFVGKLGIDDFTLFILFDTWGLLTLFGCFCKERFCDVFSSCS